MTINGRAFFYIASVLIIAFLALPIIIVSASSDVPEIVNVTLQKETVSDGYWLHLTVEAESESPVNWLNYSFDNDFRQIEGGGFETKFNENSAGNWECTWTWFVSKYAPSGKYVFSNLQVFNEAQNESTIGPVRSVDITNSIPPEKPVIESVTLNTTPVENGTRLQLTIRVLSNSPVNWVNLCLEGPHGNITGGGWEVLFKDIGSNLWEHVVSYTVSKSAPSGAYYYDQISVENLGMMISDRWPEKPSCNIVNESSPKKPVITSASLGGRITEEGLQLTLTIRAKSNSPVNWINYELYGPKGNIHGGGYETEFKRTSSDTWEYILNETLTQYSPTGEYYYDRISVMNEGMLTSDVWPHAVKFKIAADKVGEVENVFVSIKDGNTHIVFADAKVTIQLESGKGIEGIFEDGMVKIQRCDNNPVKEIPEEFISTGIYLNIEKDESFDFETLRIEVEYDRDALPEGVDEESLRLFRYNDATGSWDELSPGGVDTEKQVVWAELTRFSLFAVFANNKAFEVTPVKEDDPLEEDAAPGAAVLKSGSPIYYYLLAAVIIALAVAGCSFILFRRKYRV